jgi:hypothetical protein
VTLGSHQRTVGLSQDHISPLVGIINPLGGAKSFHLDPAGAPVRPWDCAQVTWTTGGLERDWRPYGMKYVNPPFNQYEVGDWIAKAADNGNGNAIVLLHARTEAGWFEPVWWHAACILFLADRIFFYKPDGTRHAHNSGAPPVLVAFGDEALDRLRHCGIAGTLVPRCRHIQAVGPPLYSPPRPSLTLARSVP